MLKQSRSFPCCQGTFRAVTKLQQNKKRQKLTGLLASARSPVWASEIIWWGWWPIQTPYHAFYTTLHNVPYQTVSAVIPAMRYKPSHIVTYLHFESWGRKTLSEARNSPPVGCEMVRAFVFYGVFHPCSLELIFTTRLLLESFRWCLFKFKNSACFCYRINRKDMSCHESKISFFEYVW